jgi:dTMP kinase
VFVTFEGLDGSGKTTQVERLRTRLEAEGREVVATREPGGTPLGEGIRELVLHGHEMSPWAEALLFASARAEHVEEVIRPALERGADVLCDRYVDSSLAYQGIARGLGLERVLEVNLDAVGGLMPDRTFVLALDSETASGRVGESPDRIEREEPGFGARVEAAFLELAERFPERIVVLDASLPADELAERIHGALRSAA